MSADQQPPSRPHRRFVLPGWLWRHHREPARRANLRAGVDSPAGYPFEPRY